MLIFLPIAHQGPVAQPEKIVWGDHTRDQGQRGCKSKFYTVVNDHTFHSSLQLTSTPTLAKSQLFSPKQLPHNWYIWYQPLIIFPSFSHPSHSPGYAYAKAEKASLRNLIILHMPTIITINHYLQLAQFVLNFIEFLLDTFTKDYNSLQGLQYIKGPRISSLVSRYASWKFNHPTINLTLTINIT